MPTSKAELIAQAVVAALTTPALAGVTAAILRDPLDRLDSEAYPMVAVELGDEEAPVFAVTGQKNRRVDVVVSVMHKGAAPIIAADPIATEAAGRVLANPTLGGLAMDLIEGPTERLKDERGPGSARVAMMFTYLYRTTETSKET